MSARADRLSELVHESELDALLVCDLLNVRYLTGFGGTSGLVLVGPRSRTFITDFRYLEQAAVEVDAEFDRRIASAPHDLLDLVADALPPGDVRLGFESDHTSVRQHQRLAELLGSRIELVGTSGLVEAQRAVKEPAEIERIGAAAALADASLERLLGGGLIGRTERELALALEQDMRLHGARRPSFESIIAAGPHGALPHAQPRDVEVRKGQLVVIDWGAEFEGYCSDCTRTVAAGQAPPDAREVYELVLDAQLTGVNAIRAGCSTRAVDGAAREVIHAGGHGGQFGHGLGHGVGLAVHEDPRLSQRSSEQLSEGNVVTVEPGVYVPGRFGIRIEDLVVVSNGGCEILTSISKQLLVTD